MAARGQRLPDSGENKEHSTTNPQCSCLNCDSLDCFAKRQDHKPCSCLKCENSKTCLYFPHKTSTQDKVKTSMEGDDILSKERVKREITYEFNEVSKTRSVSKHMTKALYSVNKDGEIAERDTSNQHSTQMYSKANGIPHKEHNSSAAKLSAQIMDVPYENLHGIDNKDSDTTRSKISALDVLNKIRDAYKACSCKVCECLVGTSIVPKNKTCKCEPCDCKDCMSFLTKFQYLGNPKTDPPVGCPCIRCTRSQCKGIVNKFDEPQICDCPPGYSLRCEKNYTQSCNCEPCQCLECKAVFLDIPKTFIIAPVSEQYQRHYCDCSPCECLECRGYGISRTYMREAETSVNRQPRCQCDTCTNDACIADGTQICKCQRNRKVMVKPVQKDVHDYDIRAIITEDKVIRNANSKLLKNSTIAMYATVPNVYNNTGYQKDCSCEICECVICNCKENAVDSIKSSRLFKEPDKIHFFTNSNSDLCKCAPCECHVCLNKVDERRNSKTSPISCKCGTCDCINCDKVIRDDNKFRSCVNIIKKHSIKESCRCSPCECLKCIHAITTAGDVCRSMKYSYEKCDQESKESIYPIKKAEPLTPSSFSCEIQNNNSNKYNGDRQFVRGFKSISYTKLCNSNISTQKNIGHPDYAQQGCLNNNIDSLFLSNTKTHPFPQSKYIDNQNKPRNKRSDDHICKYYTGSHSRNMYMQGSGNNYEHFKTNHSIGAVLADSRNYKYNRAAQFAIKDKESDNFCDSGCESYDYFTIHQESIKDGQNSQVSNQCSQAANYYPDGKYTNMALKNNKNRNIRRYNGKQGDHDHSFESNKKYCFSRENIVNDLLVSKLKYGKIENPSQEYGRKYWIKNIDVSVAVHDESLLDTRHSSCFVDNHSMNNTTDNTNTIVDSDENVSYSQNIGDHSLNLRSKRMVELFNNEAYYEGVQQTLHRAKVFSLELLKVLDKYERANNEFQSITQKLKVSHASLFSDNILQGPESNENYVTCLTPESNYMKTEHENDTSLQNKTNTHEKLLLSLSNDLKAQDKKDRCTQNDDWTIFNFSNECVLDKEIPEYFGDCCHKNTEKRNKKKVNEYNMFSNRKVRRIKKTNKLNVGTLKKNIIILKEDQNITASNRVIKTVVSTQTVLQLKKFKDAAINAISISRSILTDDKNATKRQQEILPISKKNFYLTTKPVAECKGNCIIPSLQEDIKQVMRSMSIQTKNSDHKSKSVPRKNEALSTKSCCDALKVNFLGLRKISDHTIRVKWTPPRITCDVTGYELLIDGRAVQKMLSPSRCVAVVTSLPHCETVLLTIRTITPLTPSGHFPSSTIIYHPKGK